MVTLKVKWLPLIIRGLPRCRIFIFEKIILFVTQIEDGMPKDVLGEIFTFQVFVRLGITFVRFSFSTFGMVASGYIIRLFEGEISAWELLSFWTLKLKFIQLVKKILFIHKTVEINKTFVFLICSFKIVYFSIIWIIDQRNVSSFQE